MSLVVFEGDQPLQVLSALEKLQALFWAHHEHRRCVTIGIDWIVAEDADAGCVGCRPAGFGVEDVVQPHAIALVSRIPPDGEHHGSVVGDDDIQLTIEVGFDSTAQSDRLLRSEGWAQR